jgi:hypothetical protein
MQPTYLPWMGYFDLIDQSDKFVFLDDVKIVYQSWMVRNRIKTSNGPIFLTIPISREKKSENQLLKDVVIDNDKPWRKKHLKSIYYEYKKSNFFDEVYPWVEKLINYPSDSLAEFNIQGIKMVCNLLGLEHSSDQSSHLGIEDLTRDNKLLAVCRRFNCDIYLSPQGSADYLEEKNPGGAFQNSSVSLYYHNYSHPTYPQLHGAFASHMCIIDLLFNAGIENALEIIRSGRKTNYHYLEFRKRFLNKS